MPKTRIQKEETVTKLAEKLGRAKSVVFADYQQSGTPGSKGMTMSQLSDLRNQLSDVSAEFTVTKNNLLKLALKDRNILTDDAVLDGPTATLFSYDDEISPIKILVKALKDNAIGIIKGGIFEGEAIDEIKINKLASLPSKVELRGQVVGVLAAPLHGIVGVLQANLRNLVYALDAIRVSKGGE